MRSVKKAFLKGSRCLPLIAVVLSSCASVDSGPVINAGDQVGVHFTCIFPNGEVAATTRKVVVFDEKLKKSPILLTVLGDDPITVTAGEPDHMSPLSTPGFEEEIIRQLTLGVVGMRGGEQRAMTLTAETIPVRGKEQQKLELPRVRHRPKVVRMPKEDYIANTRKAPEVGQSYSEEQGMVGKVTAVMDKEVTITYSAKPGSTVRTPFGVGAISEKDDRLDIDIDVKPGSLVRSGPLVGRVAEVRADAFTIDYSNAFAGNSLNCVVNAVDLHKGGEAHPAAAKPAPAIEVKSAATGNQEKKQESAITPTASQDKNQAAKEWLKSSISDAVKSGKSSVDIDVNDFPGSVGKGDLVTVRFQAKNSDGTPLTLPEGFARQDTPQELVAGKLEIFPGLGEEVIGMSAGEKKHITLTPEKAFGPHDFAKVASYPLKSTIPARITLPAEEYVKRFGGFPSVGKEVPMFPYMKARVDSVGEKDVTLAISAKDGESFNEPFGTVTLSVGLDGVTMILDPKLKAAFDTGDRQGVITARDAEKFTVDFNPPLAGKTILLDLEVVSMTKAAALKLKQIDWIEDYEKGLAKAKEDGKPTVLVLYADWCGFCKRLFAETMPDPRIEKIKDKFVWVKVNSDKTTKYKQRYAQNSFPMIVLLKSDGTVLKKIDGYRDAGALKKELDGVM